MANKKRIPPPCNSKISPLKVDALARLIKAGNYRRTAARIVGISEDSLARWIKEGAEDIKHNRNTLHAELTTRITKAEAEAEAKLLAIVRKAAQGGATKTTITRGPDGTTRKEETVTPDWTAAMTILERSRPERWARRQTISGADGGAVPISIVEIRRPADAPLPPPQDDKQPQLSGPAGPVIFEISQDKVHDQDNNQENQT